MKRHLINPDEHEMNAPRDLGVNGYSDSTLYGPDGPSNKYLERKENMSFNRRDENNKFSVAANNCYIDTDFLKFRPNHHDYDRIPAGVCPTSKDPQSGRSGGSGASVHATYSGDFIKGALSNGDVDYYPNNYRNSNHSGFYNTHTYAFDPMSSYKYGWKYNEFSQ